MCYWRWKLCTGRCYYFSDIDDIPDKVLLYLPFLTPCPDYINMHITRNNVLWEFHSIRIHINWIYIMYDRNVNIHTSLKIFVRTYEGYLIHNNMFILKLTYRATKRVITFKNQPITLENVNQRIMFSKSHFPNYMTCF